MNENGIQVESGPIADAKASPMNAPEEGIAPQAENESKMEAPAKEVGISPVVASNPQPEDGGIVIGAKEPAAAESKSLLSMTEIENAIGELDDDIENAFGRAADSIWSLASTVGTAVRETQPGLDSLAKNVSSRLAPLGSQISAIAPKEESFASITGSMKSVAQTVQRNAAAVEEAILSKANAMGGTDEVREEEGDFVTAHKGSETMENRGSVLPFLNEGVDVGKGLAKVGDTLSNSIVGQTVGGLWDGLWGGGNEDDYDDDRGIDDVPRTRFEQRLFELQANPDTYCKPASDTEAFEKWGKGFDLDNYAKSCVQILHKHDAIADLYLKVVPNMVEENTFWMRYFFAQSVLEKEEERRRKLLERAETAVVSGSMEEDGWGDDDWGDGDEEDKKPESAKVCEPSEPGPSTKDAYEKAESSTASFEAGKAGDVKSKEQINELIADKDKIPLAHSLSKETGGGWSDDDWE